MIKVTIQESFCYGPYYTITGTGLHAKSHAKAMKKATRSFNQAMRQTQHPAGVPVLKVVEISRNGKLLESQIS